MAASAPAAKPSVPQEVDHYLRYIWAANNYANGLGETWADQYQWLNDWADVDAYLAALLALPEDQRELRLWVDCG